MKRKWVLIGLGIIAFFLVSSVRVEALDTGKIVIILQPAQGWSKILTVGGVTTTTFNSVTGVSTSGVSTIGGVATGE